MPCSFSYRAGRFGATARRWTAAVIGLAHLFRAAPSQAGGGAATDAYEGIGDEALSVRGLADVYSEANFNAPPSRVNQLRAFDVTAGQPSLGIFRLTFAHKPGIVGFRLDAAAGDLADAYERSDPAWTDHPTLSRGLSYLEQAFVTATIPAGRGLELDLGKFGTPVGLEDNEALENWNYSRSLLYWLAEPSYHTGLRVTYALTDALAFSAFWVNGWDANVLDGNGMRAGAAAVTWKPVAPLEIVADYMGGLERAPTRLSDPTLTLRHELDTYVRYAVTPKVSLAWTGDYGRDAAGGGVRWWGVGAYLRVEPFDPWAMTFRAEHYDDGDGFTSGTRQRIEEATATLEARATLEGVRCIGRLEYRRDQSDVPYFATTSGRASMHQDTLGLAALVAF